jgi:hypothetical protein
MDKLNKILDLLDDNEKCFITDGNSDRIFVLMPLQKYKKGFKNGKNYAISSDRDSQQNTANFVADPYQDNEQNYVQTDQKEQELLEKINKGSNV